MNKLSLYIQEAYNELLNKVTWPTWKELQESALVVLVATVIITLVVFAMDFTSRIVFTGVYDILIGN
jgi:preprotein translocase subunit SecE